MNNIPIQTSQCQQLQLDFTANPRIAPTSLAAYDAILPVLPARASAVMKFIRAQGPAGATNSEIANFMRCQQSSVPCITGRLLLRSGKIKDAGFKRLTAAGRRQATVYVATEVNP